jgi:hypothetical protein
MWPTKTGSSAFKTLGTVPLGGRRRQTITAPARPELQPTHCSAVVQGADRRARFQMEDAP